MKKAMIVASLSMTGLGLSASKCAIEIDALRLRADNPINSGSRNKSDRKRNRANRWNKL